MYVNAGADKLVLARRAPVSEHEACDTALSDMGDDERDDVFVGDGDRTGEATSNKQYYY